MMDPPSLSYSMVQYCGYLVRDDWLLRRALEMGLKPPETLDEQFTAHLKASRNAMLNTGVYLDTTLRRVKTPQPEEPGKSCWCIAFASNNPLEGLPTSRPPEKKYKALQELLQEKDPPRWFRAID